MSEVKQEDWQRIQSDINSCQRCKADTLLDTKSIAPARPWNPMHTGRLLLISENPPITGGFWETKQEDGLRTSIFRLLKVPKHSNANEDFESFLSRQSSCDLQFFLIQTFKWPYASSLREQKKGYNQLRNSMLMRQMLEHSASAHLGLEIAAIRPIGILAMGNAAWDACRSLSIEKAELPHEGIQRVRGRLYALQLRTGTIPLHVTHLPVGRNMNYPRRAKEIAQDIDCFLRAHIGHKPSC